MACVPQSFPYPTAVKLASTYYLLASTRNSGIHLSFESTLPVSSISLTPAIAASVRSHDPLRYRSSHLAYDLIDQINRPTTAIKVLYSSFEMN